MFTEVTQDLKDEEKCPFVDFSDDVNYRFAELLDGRNHPGFVTAVEEVSTNKVFGSSSLELCQPTPFPPCLSTDAL